MIQGKAGFSLIEVILSMWLTGIVVFSTMVCTSSIEAKSGQRKIQAKALAKSEIDKLRFWAYKGFLVLNRNPGLKKDGVRHYSLIIWTLDKRIVRLTSDGVIKNYTPQSGSEDEFNYYRRIFIPLLAYDSYGATSTTEKVNIYNGFSFIKGNLINDARENLHSAQSVLSFREQAYDFVIKRIQNLEFPAEYVGILNSNKKNLVPFIVDVNVYEAEKLENDKPMFLYNLYVQVGWLEKRGGGYGITSDYYFSKVLTDSEPTFYDPNGSGED